MSERKVLNKYYPPDFDPSKIPRLKQARNRQYTVRLMAPFNMRCVTCGEYIYKGKKFNARKEDVENEDYLGIRIYRFYIKCTRCLQEISFKTDPRNTDYEIEAGATRNFMALKRAEEQAERELQEIKEDEANNPMKQLENRTQQSRNEIELLESLEELKDLNRRQQSVDYDTMLQQYDKRETAKEREERIARMDEEYIKTIKFGGESSGAPNKVVISEEIIELNEENEEDEDDDDGDSDDSDSPPSKTQKLDSETTSSDSAKNINNTVPKKVPTWGSVGVRKTTLTGLVKKKTVDLVENKVVEIENKGGIEKPASGLALLGCYSGSDSNESE